MAIVRELITRFGFNVDQSGMNKVEGSINRLSGMLSGLAAFASLRALAGVADSMQSLEARIGMLPQTLGDVGDAFNEVGQHALATRTPLAAYGTLYTRLGNAAKAYITDQKELLQVTDTIANSLVVGGATAQEASSAMLQFAQALGAGALAGEEFRAMGEATPQYMDQLAEAMGFPREQLKKMASDGKLTSKLVIEATKKMSDYFERRAKQMPMSIGQAYSDIGTRFGIMVQNMNRDSKVVTKIAEFMIGGFKHVEEAVKDFVKFVGGGSNAVKALGIALAALFGPMALAGLVTILGAVFSIGGLVVVGLVLLGVAIDDVLTYLSGGESIWGRFIDTLNGEAAPALMTLVAILYMVGAQFVYVAAKAAITQAVIWATGNAFVVSAAKMILASGVLSAAFWMAGLKMAASWVMILGPIALIIAAVAGIVATIYYVWENWDKITGWMGDKVKWLIDKLKSLGKYLPSFGGEISVNPTSISPASVAGSSAVGGPTVTSNQTVYLTVPNGTPESQQDFLKTSAGILKGEGVDKKIARDMGLGGYR